MHVLQHIAIKVNAYPDEIQTLEDCKQEAFNTVRGIFEDMYSESEGLGGWSDWYVVGGGRWNSDEDNQYKEAWNDVISYVDNPTLFNEKVDGAIEARVDTFNDYRKRFNDQSLDINAKLDKYDGLTDYSFDLYELNKCIDMLQGKWDMNSYFYDLNNWSTNPKFMLDNVDDSWYLVPVDFHF